MNLTQILDDIKKIVIEHPFDPLHDIAHHYEVWKNVKNIIYMEKLNVDSDILEIAAWSHDIEAYYESTSNNDKLKSVLEKHKIPKDKQRTIFQIIEEHHFDKEQKLVESGVLFDADKLEHISIPRWRYAIRAYRDGMLREDMVKFYEMMQNKLLDHVYDRLNFDYSRKKYKKRLKVWLEFANEQNILVDGKIKLTK